MVSCAVMRGPFIAGRVGSEWTERAYYYSFIKLSRDGGRETGHLCTRDAEFSCEILHTYHILPYAYAHIKIYHNMVDYICFTLLASSLFFKCDLLKTT